VQVTVFGLGEAGSLIAADLARAGAEVNGYDPADVATPGGVTRFDDPGPSVSGSSLVMAVTAASDAQQAMAQAWDRMRRGTIYADLSTAPPSLKEDLADTAATGGLVFVDVALMATVPGHGLATPALACGPGATGYAAMVNRLGANVEVLSGQPGQAAARKLLRSVVTKGLTSLLVESLDAAEARGDTEWLWGHLVQLLTNADERLMRRLIEGTPGHAERRIDEMESARALLESLEVESTMTSATVETLRRIHDQGMGAFPIPGD
jgi:3-hydroxyisobutyrate dehydrogenase-like beta-hydroxyacid dehydrogenase